MSRSRFPPTPAMSGELIVKDQPAVDGTDSFALPPAAIPSADCPASPASPDSSLGRNAPSTTRQTGVKRPLEDFDLPPPPTRTRKIIQMKPKPQSPPKPQPHSNKPASKENGKATAPAAQPQSSKKKQPSATSAAGRKIARKTAHSLIERRRRSKMNEEFSTLKDMIPACRGQDMHKLAILQASIDYVNYLEQCIQDLKTAGDDKSSIPQRLPPGPPSPSSPEFVGEEEGGPYSASVSPEFKPCETSPAFSPRSRVPSTGGPVDFLPPSNLPSPALGPSQHSWAAPSTNGNHGSADVDHEASAALLMLNRDCRTSVGSAHEEYEDQRGPAPETPKRVSMSVRDLLIS